MHKPVSALLSDGGTPGRLGEFATALGKAGINIRSIGGSEWGHRGAVALLIDDDADQMATLRSVAEVAGFPIREMFGVEVEIPDYPGSIGGAASILGEAGLDILTVLVVDSHDSMGLVSFGFETPAEAGEARRVLAAWDVGEHGIRKLWQEHEDWDEANGRPPRPKRPMPEPPGPG